MFAAGEKKHLRDPGVLLFVLDWEVTTIPQLLVPTKPGRNKQLDNYQKRGLAWSNMINAVLCIFGNLYESLCCAGVLFCCNVRFNCGVV